MRVLHVVDGILVRPLPGEVDVELDRLVVSARDEVPARSVHADGVEEFVQEDDVAAALGHLLRLAALDEVDELVDEHLERLARMAEHLGQRLETRDVAVVIRSEDVDQAVEAVRVLAADVRGVLREVRRCATGADEHPILVVTVRARARPHGRVLLEGVEERNRIRNLGLDLGLARAGVELDAEALEGSLHRGEHPGNGVARIRSELVHVLAVISVLGRLFASPQRLDRRVEALHLRARVVVVVLALDLVPCECEQASDRVAVRAVARMRDRDRPGRVGRDHLDLDALVLHRRSRTELDAYVRDATDALGEPGIRDPEIDEPGSCRLRPLCDPGLHGLRRELGRDVAWRPLLESRELERDVRRVVAVLGIGRALERDRHARELVQRVGEPCDGIVGGDACHASIVGRGGATGSSQLTAPT